MVRERTASEDIENIRMSNSSETVNLIQDELRMRFALLGVEVPYSTPYDSKPWLQCAYSSIMEKEAYYPERG